MRNHQQSPSSMKSYIKLMQIPFIGLEGVSSVFPFISALFWYPILGGVTVVFIPTMLSFLSIPAPILVSNFKGCNGGIYKCYHSNLNWYLFIFIMMVYHRFPSYQRFPSSIYQRFSSYQRFPSSSWITLLCVLLV